jgi:hypothetical protein
VEQKLPLKQILILVEKEINMKKLYIWIFICSFFSVSCTYADFVGRAICLNSYTNALTKCGPNPGITSPIAYAKWNICVNAAIASYYACIARTYSPFDYSIYPDMEDVEIK